MRLTLNWSSRHPDMKNDIAIITPPVIIRWSGFFKMLNLENVVTYKIDEWFWDHNLLLTLRVVGRLLDQKVVLGQCWILGQVVEFDPV